MDIFEFINSCDIREYLKSLGYKFNTLEASWLVYQSGRHTLEEKFDAWNWIIENMPDCEVKERLNCIYRESLHETLKAYMNLMKKFVHEFYENEGCVYTYDYWCEGFYERMQDNGLFETVDSCLEDLFSLQEEEDVIDIRVHRKSTLEEKHFIRATFNNNKEILSIVCSGRTGEESELMYEFFEGLWFAFPTPFKPGDVLTHYNEKAYPEDRSERKLLVFQGCTPEWLKNEYPEKLAKWLDGSFGDNSDMNIWGYFQNIDGRIFHESTWNYMDYEYYRGSFEGKSRAMKAISSFMKEEISLDLLLAAYKKVIFDELANYHYLLASFTDEGLELAGLADEIKNKR